MLGLENSASASSAAFFIDCAAAPAFPPALKGKISATRAAPAPDSNPGPDGCSEPGGPAAMGPLGAVSIGPPIGPSAVEQPASRRPIQEKKTRIAGNRRLGFPWFAVTIMPAIALEAVTNRPLLSGPEVQESKECRTMRRALCGCPGAR